MYVTSKDGEWWSGTLENGKSGDFPASFLDQGEVQVFLAKTVQLGSCQGWAVIENLENRQISIENFN